VHTGLADGRLGGAVRDGAGRAVSLPKVSLSLVRRSDEHLRTGPWRGQDEVAYVAPVPGVALPSADGVRRTCARLAGNGFRRVITAALDPAEANGFMRAGFTVRERLLVLSRSLHDLPPAPAVALRRARRADRPRVLAVDSQAFSTFWRLDGGGLEEAIRATPVARFRVGEAAGGVVVAYAIWGRAGRRGYLQRLAVEPAHQRAGFGAALVVDGLRWLRRRGGELAVVNTQTENHAALALYDRLGFRREPGGLVVLEADLA
jgi:ribosomal protein S18 acetylase RimI-like enzyme